ncbi:ATP-dependent DNA ligase [Pseudomonas sp. NUPR-001]|uniref:ATP-dependent DNA ligase n=1 Tax=Pseudomonas sp. NUPR-001 TaxID=3416058 RepID=UPI003F97CBE5
MSTVDKNVLTRMTGRKPAKLVQLVQDLDDVAKKNLKPAEYLYHVTTKLDGVFALFVWIAGGWATFSRTGEQMKSCGHIERRLEELNIPKTVVVIGEVLKLNPIPEGSPEDFFEALSYAPVQDTSGAFRRHKRDESLRLVVHDFLSLEGFTKGTTKSAFGDRMMRAERCGLPMTRDKAPLVRLPEFTCVTLELAQVIAEQVIDDGGEGVIVRDLEATWEAGKRDHRIMRIKEKITKDLKVTGVQEGVGKMAGMAGALLCRWRLKNGLLVDIPVAGGDFETRKAWLKDPSLIVGQIVEVEAMKMTPTGALREPRFKGIRHDKAEADV